VEWAGDSTREGKALQWRSRTPRKVWDCMREREEGAAMEKDGIIEEKENGGE
jgi:hypothetical protein